MNNMIWFDELPPGMTNGALYSIQGREQEWKMEPRCTTL